MSKVADVPRLADRFSYSVFYSADDEGFVATVAEFPSLSWIAEQRLVAEDGLVALVEEVLVDMEHSGESVPEPFGEGIVSGKCNLRLPTSLHRERQPRLNAKCGREAEWR